MACESVLPLFDYFISSVGGNRVTG